MRKMKDSGIAWIGEIPEDWGIIKSKYVVKITNGMNPTTEGNIPVYGSGAESFKTCGEYKNPPAVLIGRKGATLHIPHYIDIPYWNVDTAFDVKPFNNFCIKFYYYLSICFDYKLYISSTTLPSMTQSTYNNIYLPFLKKEEQQRIADYLDAQCAKIDSTIAKTQQIIEKLKAYKQSVITEAVTKGLNPDAPMKDSGIEWIGEIPERWSVTSLKKHIDILPGYAFPSADFATDTGIPLLRGINVAPSHIRWDDVVCWDKEIGESLSRFLLEEGDLVVGLDRPWITEGTRISFVKKKDLPCLLLQRVCRIRAKESADIKYLFYILGGEFFKESLSTDTTGISVPHISTKQIENFCFVIPPLAEQQQIASYLDDKCAKIDEYISKKQEVIEKLTAYKKSLIFEVVTGKKEI